MDYRRFGNTVIARLDRGEEILDQIRILCEREGVRLAAVSGLGAVDDFTVGVFYTDTKQYQANSFQGPYEITSLTGTVNTMGGRHYCHLHMSAGDASGHVVGGHLNRAVISATCELVLQVCDGSEGDAIELKYKPDDPQKAVRPEQLNPRSVRIVLTAGIILLITGIILFLACKR